MSNNEKIESTENEQDSSELEIEVKRVKTVKTSLKGGSKQTISEPSQFLSLGSCTFRG